MGSQNKCVGVPNNVVLETAKACALIMTDEFCRTVFTAMLLCTSHQHFNSKNIVVNDRCFLTDLYTATLFSRQRAHISGADIYIFGYLFLNNNSYELKTSTWK